MKIHEYQAKEVLRRYGVATPRGKVTEDASRAAAICEELGGRVLVPPATWEPSTASA